MTKNLGTADRVVRLVIALFIGAGIFFTDSLIMKIILTIGSLFVFYEALASWCILYSLLGKNSCPISFPESKKAKK